MLKIKIIIIGFFAFFALPAMADWVEPTCNPTVAPGDCDIAAPINVSSAEQTKAGELNLQSTLNVQTGTVIGSGYYGVSSAPADGMIVQGQVGIGTAKPQNQLDVYGNTAVGTGYAGVRVAPADGMIVQGKTSIGTYTSLASYQAYINGGTDSGLYVVGGDAYGTYSRGATYGVRGYSTGTYGGYFQGATYGVRGYSTGTYGGYFQGATYGSYNTGNTGVYAQGNTNYGLHASSGGEAAIFAEGDSDTYVMKGRNVLGTAITLEADQGLYTKSTQGSTIGIESRHEGFSSTAVFGDATGAQSYGVRGEASDISSAGVYGKTNSAASVGVKGESAEWYGIEADSTNSYAIRADSVNGNGAWIQSNADTGIFGIGPLVGVEGQGDIGVKGNSTGDGVTAVEGFSSGANSWGVYCNANGVGAKCGGNKAWTNTSDGRKKDNVYTIEGALEKVMKLRGVTFTWKDSEYEKTEMGFIAQEVLAAAPEVVSIDNNGYYTMETGQLTALLAEAIKEQQNQIEQLKSIVCADHPDEDICHE